MPATLELRGFGHCADSSEREFSSISSLLVDYRTSQKELAKVYAIEPHDYSKRNLKRLTTDNIHLPISVSAKVEPKGLPGRLTVQAQTDQFYSQGSKSPTSKHKLQETVKTELTLILVNFVEAHPPSVVLWNRPNARTSIQLHGGSGHFYVDSSEIGKNINIEYNEDMLETSTKVVEIQPLRTGNFSLPVYDICIDSHPLEVPIKVTELSGISMDNAQFIELFSQVVRKVKLYDVDGQVFSLEDVGLENLQVTLSGQYFRVEK